MMVVRVYATLAIVAFLAEAFWGLSGNMFAVFWTVLLAGRMAEGGL